MGRTRLQLRQLTAQQLGLPLLSGTSTASSATTLTSVAEAGKAVDDELIGAHVYLPNATVPNRRVTDNVQSTGVVTFTPSSSAGMDGTDDFEVLAFSPDAIHQAIDQALMALYLEGLLTRKLWYPAVSGSPIYNGVPSYWTSSSALHGWTTTTLTLARTQAAAHKWVGEDAAAFSTASGNIQLAAPWKRFLSDLAPGTIRLYAWLKSDTASSVRAAIVQDDGTLTRTSYHSGDGAWELLKAEKAMANTDLDWSVRVEYSGSGTSHMGEVWVEGAVVPDLHPIPIALLPKGPTSVFLTPLSYDATNLRADVMPRRAIPLNHWDFVRFHDEAADVEQGAVRWLRTPPAGHRLWFYGEGPYTLPTAETSVVEVDQRESLIVAKVAAIVLLEADLLRAPTARRDSWAERIARLKLDIATLARGQGGGGHVAPLGLIW